MTHTTRISFAAAGLAVASWAPQQLPTRTLGKPDVEYSEPFSGVASVLELQSGRVIVADTREKTLQIIDLTSGAAKPIGREGSGPREWGRAMRALRMPGDTAYIYDLSNARFLIVGPDGTPVRTFSPYAEAAQRAGGRVGDGNDAGRGGRSGGRGGTAGRGGETFSIGSVTGASVLIATQTDAQGRMYFAGFPVVMTAQGPTAADTFPLLRQLVTSTKADTVAFLRNPPNASEFSAARGGGVAFRINNARPFESSDAWVAFPDGRVVVVRVADYHLDIVLPDGRVTRGAPVRYTPVRVTEAEKREWRESRAGATMISVTGQSIPLSTFPEPESWPGAKSPFAANSVFAAPNGDTWVFRQRAADDHVPVADVFDQHGVLVSRVTLPRGVRPISFGARGLYALRTDADGLQYLQRYAKAWER
jgi:hypothetical protein